MSKPIYIKDLTEDYLAGLEVELQESDSKQAQDIAFVRHNGSQLRMRTHKFQLVEGGIPKKNEHTQSFIKEARDQARIDIPLDLSDPKSVQMIEGFAQLEKRIKELAEAQLKKFAPKKYQKYEFQSIVRPARQTDEDEENPREHHQMFKAKIRLNDDMETLNLDSRRGMQVWVKNGPNEKRVKVEPQTPQELAELVRFRSTDQVVVTVSKLWFRKTAEKGKIPYGVSFRVTGLLVENQEATEPTEEFGADMFSDDEDEAAADETPVDAAAAAPADHEDALDSTDEA